MQRLDISLVVYILLYNYCAAAIVYASSIRTKDNALEFLYNLEKDPYESKNLAEKASYASELNAMREMAATYVAQLGQADYHYDSALINSAFEKANGFAPWIDDTSKRHIEQQSYFSSSSLERAPNVVFLLVDDWGHNELGVQSTYQSWTMPHVNELASNGIVLSNYYSHEQCMPARAALLTGRYGFRYAMETLGRITSEDNPKHELPLSAVTMAEEFKSAGYRTAAIGKWHMGYSSLSKYPTYRGFDSFYGFLERGFHYTTKKSDYGTSSYLGLIDNETLVSDPAVLAEDNYGALVIQAKAEDAIVNHALNHRDKPLFLYYATPLVHDPFGEMPAHWLALCATSTQRNAQEKCAMTRMLDEMVHNLTCTLQRFSLWDNTLFVMASDNGATSELTGCNYPFRGHKFELWRGAQNVPAFVHSPSEKLIPAAVRGSVYSGMVHVTDWLPSLLTAVTAGQWMAGRVDPEAPLPDGLNVWDAIVHQEQSPRTEIAHFVDSDDGYVSVQNAAYKYILSNSESDEPQSSPDTLGAGSVDPYSCEVGEILLPPADDDDNDNYVNNDEDDEHDEEATVNNTTVIIGDNDNYVNNDEDDEYDEEATVNNTTVIIGDNDNYVNNDEDDEYDEEATVNMTVILGDGSEKNKNENNQGMSYLIILIVVASVAVVCMGVKISAADSFGSLFTISAGSSTGITGNTPSTHCLVTASSADEEDQEGDEEEIRSPDVEDDGNDDNTGGVGAFDEEEGIAMQSAGQCFRDSSRSSNGASSMEQKGNADIIVSGDRSSSTVVNPVHTY